MSNRPLTIAEQSAHFLNRPHEGPPTRPVTGPAAWYGPDLTSRGDSWRDAMAAVDCDHALAFAEGRPESVPDEEKREHALLKRIASWRDNLTEGRGVQLVSGFPVERWSVLQAKQLMVWLGSHLGRLGEQNPAGDLIGEVQDTGVAEANPYVRNYVTSKEFRAHCDAADVLGLLCIRSARTGGRNHITSSVTVWNELHNVRPDLAERLFRPVLLDLRNEQPTGSPGYAEVTPCACSGSRLSTLYISDYFRSVERFPEVTLDRSDLELFDLYEDLANSPELSLEVTLEPGDLLLLNNHVTLHSRTEFYDDNATSKRLLLRFLVSLDYTEEAVS